MNNSRIMNVRVFNDLLDQLLEYLEYTFPFYQSDIMLSRTGIDFLRKSNYRLVVMQFIDHVYPYAVQINNCDENFFINFEKNLNLDTSNILLGMKIKNIWTSPETTKKQKATIFYFFQKLIQSSSKCIN